MQQIGMIPHQDQKTASFDPPTMSMDTAKNNRRWESGKHRFRLFILTVMACFSLLTGAGMTFGQDSAIPENTAASVLKTRYAAFQAQHGSTIQHPFYLDSGESDNELRGEIQAVMDQPYSVAVAALKEPSAWCDILSLHLNIKYCRVQKSGPTQTLSVYIGRKFEQPLSDATPVIFTFTADTSLPDYLHVASTAPNGPFDTRDYRILLEAVPVEKERTFIRLSYTYKTSLMARLALKCYLNTIGSSKVGFTVIGRKPDGQPIYTGDMRGVVERNTMRYYLAVEAYLNALSLPEAQRLDGRLQHWFEATEHYSLQLHEMEKAEYLTMKHREYARQTAKP